MACRPGLATARPVRNPFCVWSRRQSGSASTNLEEAPAQRGTRPTDRPSGPMGNIGSWRSERRSSSDHGGQLVTKSAASERWEPYRSHTRARPYASSFQALVAWPAQQSPGGGVINCRLQPPATPANETLCSRPCHRLQTPATPSNPINPLQPLQSLQRLLRLATLVPLGRGLIGARRGKSVPRRHPWHP